MNIEEIESEWNYIYKQWGLPDECLSFADEYLGKLIVVAKAAEYLCLYEDMLGDDHPLVLAIENLKKETEE